MVQIVYDKIVNFCGMSSIPCVIVGAKNDLTQRYHITLQPVVAFDVPACILIGLSDRSLPTKAKVSQLRITLPGSRLAQRPI